MADEITKTSIDALVEYLKAHGETEASVLAKALGVSETLIEEWSNILEKSNIVKISYRAGKMYVAPLAVTKESLAEVQHKIEIKKENIINEATAKLTMLNQLNEKVENLSKFVSQGNELLKKRIGPIKENLDELYKIANIAEKKYNEVKERKKEIDNIAERLNKEINGLKERAQIIEHFQLDTANAERLIEDMHSKMELMRKMLEEEEANRKKALQQLEESEKKLADGIRAEINAIDETISTNEKELNESKMKSNEYKRSALKLEKELEELGKKATDQISKDREEVERYMNIIEKGYIDLKNKIEELKKDIGDISKIDELIRNAQNTIEEVNKAKGPLIDELNKIIEEAKKVETLSKEDIVTSTKKAEELEERTNKASKEIDQLDNALSKADEDIGNAIK
ncbi:MAG: hypothetical protein RXO35_04030 [Candidatus Micrarchaeota archaeon]